MTTKIRILSVNIGSPRTIVQGGRKVTTAIIKTARLNRVLVTHTGLADDSICDSRYHGGPDQAVYIYRQEDYKWWENELDREITPGTFGENLTISGIPHQGLYIGDVIKFPDLELQITAPRIPCATLAATMGDPGFVKRFLRAERPGFYCRVLKTGSIEVADAGDLGRYRGQSILTTTFYNDVQRKLNREELEAYLALPIDSRSRTDFEKSLASLLAEEKINE